MGTKLSAQRLASAGRFSAHCLLYCASLLVRIVWRFGTFAVRLIGVVVIFLMVLFVLLDTKRDVAYRYSPPGSPACKAQLENVTALAEVDNDETSAKLNSEVKLKKAFTCALQQHSLRAQTDPSTNTGNPSLTYYLSFLEFQENGQPVQDGEDNQSLNFSQLKVLLDHLKKQRDDGKQNFVLAFIHGWRHDARIGDENVKNTRLMAAYLTSFLEQRCTKNQRYCKVAVTAVYVGWRGARLNEGRLSSPLSNYLAAMTLFDRKPVSERIAPAVISALHAIDLSIFERTPGRPYPTSWYDQPRLITIGHSLGGNVLAFGLKERMIDLINQYQDFNKPDAEKTLLKSPIGNLIVLLNPASEAINWIALQRAFQARVRGDTTSADVQKAYSDRQPPIYVSLTAARSWPANDVLRSDVAAIADELPKRPVLMAKRKERDPTGSNDCTSIRLFHSEYRPYYDYDTATYDLFPFYKWDFRPLAQTILEHTDPDPFKCNEATYPTDAPKVPNRPNFIVRFFWRNLAAFFRNFPFMNTDVTQTRTIGNLDPVRSPFGKLFNEENDPATWHGTTHELLINFIARGKTGQAIYTQIQATYLDAASLDKSECAVADNWLTMARRTRGTQTGHGPVNWDSSGIAPSLTPVKPRPGSDENISGQIRQTLFFSGMRSITGANDPFWNVRAFQSAMTNHSGYVSYPLMCTIFQLVMDKVTEDKPADTRAPVAQQ
jgi:hypothetical protein